MFLNLIILPKIKAAWIVLIFTCGIVASLISSPVQAASNSNVLVEHNVVAEIAADLAAQMTYTMAITNNANELVREIEIKMPFVGFDGLGGNVDGMSWEVGTEQTESTTTVRVDLGEYAVRTGQTRTVMLTFNTKGFLKHENETYSIVLPAVTTQYQLHSFGMTLIYPESFPEVSYISSPNLSSLPNTIEMTSVSGGMVVWGTGNGFSVRDRVSLAPETSGYQLVSLPRYSASQNVSFEQISGGKYGSDKWGNTWTLLPADAELYYQANVFPISTATDEFVVPDAVTIAESIWGDFNQRVNLMGVTEQSKLSKMVYDYLLFNYQPLPLQLGSRLALDALNSEEVNRRELNSFEYAYLLSGLLSRLSVDNRVVYGYLVGVNMPGFDMTAPHVWVEASISDKVAVFDPYLHEISGYEFANVSSVNRLVMGVWDKDAYADSVLGILTGAPRRRPEIGPVLTVANAAPDWRISVTAPEVTYAGEYYTLDVYLTNDTVRFINVSDIVINGVSLGEYYLPLTRGIYVAFPPGQQTKLRLDNLREPDFFLQETRAYNLKVASDSLGERTVNYSIRFEPDGRIVYIAIFIAILIAIFSGGVYAVRVGWVEIPTFLRKQRPAFK